MTADGVVFAIGGRGGSRTAVRAGGKGDVTKTHVVWTARHQGQVSTPIVHDGRIYFVNGGVAHCIDASRGNEFISSTFPVPVAVLAEQGAAVAVAQAVST